MAPVPSSPLRTVEQPDESFDGMSTDEKKAHAIDRATRGIGLCWIKMARWIREDIPPPCTHCEKASIPCTIPEGMLVCRGCNSGMLPCSRTHEFRRVVYMREYKVSREVYEKWSLEISQRLKLDMRGGMRAPEVGASLESPTFKRPLTPSPEGDENSRPSKRARGVLPVELVGSTKYPGDKDMAKRLRSASPETVDEHLRSKRVRKSDTNSIGLPTPPTTPEKSVDSLTFSTESSLEDGDLKKQLKSHKQKIVSLEGEIKRLQQERATDTARIVTLEEVIRANGLPIPPEVVKKRVEDASWRADYFGDVTESPLSIEPRDITATRGVVPLEEVDKIGGEKTMIERRHREGRKRVSEDRRKVFRSPIRRSSTEVSRRVSGS